MVTLFLRQGENGKQVLLSFPATTLTEIADVAATLETLKSMSKTVTIQGAASEVKIGRASCRERVCLYV